MISVIIPLYNKSHYISKAIRSVLEQTFRKFELVIINDGSTDNGVEIVLQTISIFSFINITKRNVGTSQDGISSDQIYTIQLSPGIDFQLISQPNQGVSTARNNGVAAAKYEYIAFLDADDWWEPTFLEEMVQLIEDFPKAAIYGSRYYWVKNGTNNVSLNHEDDNFRGYFDYIKAYTYAWWMPLTSISVVIRKDVFNEIGGFKPTLRFGEDFDFWVRIALKYPVAYLNKPLAFYNQDVPSTLRALGAGKPWKTSEHFIFNLDFLQEEENNNPDLKKLLDGLRVRSLIKFHLNNWYPKEVNQILSNVDFALQPSYFQRVYTWPRPLVNAWFRFKAVGSMVKQSLIRLCV